MRDFPKGTREADAELELELDMTAAARELLDTHLSDYRGRIVRELGRSRRRRRIDTARVRAAIARVAASSNLPRLAAERRWSLGRWPAAFLTAAVGVGVATAAVAASLRIDGEGASTVAESVALVSGAIGGALALMVAVSSLTLVRTTERKEEVARSAATAHEFVMQLAGLETLAYDVVDYLSKESGAGSRSSRTLRQALDWLARAGAWSDEDVAGYRSILRLRNQLVHQDRLTASPEELAFAMAETERLRDLLNRWYEALQNVDSKQLKRPNAGK